MRWAEHRLYVFRPRLCRRTWQLRIWSLLNSWPRTLTRSCGQCYYHLPYSHLKLQTLGKITSPSPRPKSPFLSSLSHFCNHRRMRAGQLRRRSDTEGGPSLVQLTGNSRNVPKEMTIDLPRLVCPRRNWVTTQQQK